MVWHHVFDEDGNEYMAPDEESYKVLIRMMEAGKIRRAYREARAADQESVEDFLKSLDK